MAEDNQEVKQEENAEVVAVAEPSAIELRAIEMGWRPKEEFDGNPDDFIDASEFVRRKPLFEKIDNVGKELRETKKALLALQAHHQKVKEVEFKKALEQLKAEKKTALEEGDASKLIEIDDQIAEARQAQVTAQAQLREEVNKPHPGFINWVNKNTWYRDNAELKVAADQIGTAYAASNPDKDPDDILKYVEGRIRKLYPETFSNPNKSKPSVVEGSTQTPVVKKKSSLDDYPLTEDERRVMMSFVRQGVMTKEEYIKDLKAIKGEE